MNAAETPKVQHWGYDFTCWTSIEDMLATFNAAGPWRWVMGDSDVYGFYPRCRPSESSRIAVYNEAELRTGSRRRSHFWAELYSEPEARPEIDQHFRALLQRVKARDITES